MGSGTFGAIVRLALLTAQHREKIAGMRWADLSSDGRVWTVPGEGEDREKGNGGVLHLPDAAVAIVRAQPRSEGNEHVFAGRDKGHFVGFSPCKAAFDDKVLNALPPETVKELRARAKAAGEDPAKVKALPNWTLHDCRRTARSLLARAGVLTEVAERVLGHVQGDLIETYNRHAYVDEKAAALKKLAALIEAIVHPEQGDNVMPFPAYCRSLTAARGVGGMKWPPKQLGDLLADMDALGEALEIAHKTFDKSSPHAQSGEDLATSAPGGGAHVCPGRAGGDLSRECQHGKRVISGESFAGCPRRLLRSIKTRLRIGWRHRGRASRGCELTSQCCAAGSRPLRNFWGVMAAWAWMPRRGMRWNGSATLRRRGCMVASCRESIHIRGWRNRKLWMPATWEGYRQQEHVAHHLLVEQ